MLRTLTRSLALMVPPIRALRERLLESQRSLDIATSERDAARTALANYRDQEPPPPARPEPLAAPEIVHFVDEAWCDIHGVFLRGWAHAGVHAVRAIALVSGRHRIETTDFTFRPDVRPHYPHIPETGAAAFSLYLPCDPFTPVHLHVSSDGGNAQQPVHVPPPAPPDTGTADGAYAYFISALRERRGRVLEIGARVVGSLTQGSRASFEPDCTYLANDIHPGPGIDLVGDTHALTSFVAPGSLDGLFSVAVLEHLVAPWIAAAEMNRALAPGGLVFHVTHQTWPIHETPNDFFRFSDEALKSLFGPRSGFEVVECGMTIPVQIIPPPTLRHTAWLRTPAGRGFGQVYILARKIGDPLADDLSSISRAYPVS